MACERGRGGCVTCLGAGGRESGLMMAVPAGFCLVYIRRVFEARSRSGNMGCGAVRQKLPSAASRAGVVLIVPGTLAQKHSLSV